MELKQISHSLLALIAILYVAICHPHYPSDSWECCDVTVGYACFCEIPQEIEDYWGYYEQPNYNHLYYGDCKCNEISQLSVVLLTEDYAESIAIFDTNDEDNIHCFFEHIHQGEEIVCNAKGDDQVFADSTSFIIERSDRSLCQGRIDTTCAGDIIINEVDDRCAELVVVGYISDEGDVCDDGLSPCQCVGRYKRIIKPTNIDIHLDRDRDDRDSDKNNDDEDSDKIDDNQDIDSDDGDGDEVLVSPLFAEFLDNTRDTDSFGDDSISFSYSDSDSDSDSDSYSNSKSNSKSSSKSKSSKSKSESKSSSKSGSKSKSKSKSNSNSKSGENDGRFRILEPIFINDDNNNERSIENDENDALFRTDPDEIDERIDDDLFFIDSDDSNDGLFIDNESNESERSREEREREREREEEDARAMASPLNMPSVNIIDENMTKTSIYVTMSYYIILLIILINTLTFSFYFCVRPLQKYCKENEFNMDYNGYYIKPSSKSSHSKDIIIRSSIDYIDTDDDDISSLSDKTEEEE